MKIAVLGARGFLGSYLCGYLAGKQHEVIPVTRDTVNLNDYEAVDQWLSQHRPDIIINCAISGGGVHVNDINYSDVQRDLGIFLNFYNNPQVHKYINVGSGAEFDRRVSIDNCAEEYIKSVTPIDSYGYTKNIIARMCLGKSNFYTLRLFGCFDSSEPDIRLFKRFLADPNLVIKDRQFDYISARDFAKIVEYYCDYNALPKDINCVYTQKKMLSDMLQMLRPGAIINKVSNTGDVYTGTGVKLAQLSIDLDGLEKGIKSYD